MSTLPKNQLQHTFCIVVMGTMSTLALLTLDWAPLVGMIIALVCYFIVLIFIHDRYTQALASIDPLVNGLSPWVLATVVVGSVATVMFGFDSPVLAGFWRREPWEGWHLAAITWTLLIGFYCLVAYIPAISPGVHQALLGLFVFGLIGCCFYYFNLPHPTPAIHRVEVAWFLALLSLVIDALLFWDLRSHTSANKHRTRVRQTLVAADLPALGTFSILWLYLYIGPNSNGGEPWYAFVDGAIAFQLLTSKAVFILIESGGLE